MGPEEVAIVLRMVLNSQLTIPVSILTSKIHQRDIGITEPYKEAYLSFWKSISDQDAPETLILIAGLRSSKKSPIHPRWWLTKYGGLRIDDSLRSLGDKRDSEIFSLDTHEVTERTSELLDYFELRKREHGGERLDIDLVTLP